MRRPPYRAPEPSSPRFGPRLRRTRVSQFLPALVLPLVLAVALTPSPGLRAQEGAGPAGEVFGERLQITAVDLVVDVRDKQGRVPADLGPEDFQVLEDGELRLVVAVEPFRQGPAVPAPLETSAPSPAAVPSGWDWHLAIYIDRQLTSTSSLRRATESLARQAGTLTGLGQVEVVVADPHPRQVLPPTRSARALEQTLLELNREMGGMDEVRRVRRRFLDVLVRDRELIGRGTGGHSVASAGRRNLVWSTVLQEDRLLRLQHDNLVAWAAGHAARQEARGLLLVSDGFDLDPRDFYLQGVEEPEARSDLAALLQAYSPEERYQRLTEVLAARGWVCLNLALGGSGATFNTMAAEISGKGRMGGARAQGGGLPDQLFYRPLDGLRNLAAETGGELITGTSKVPEALAGLADRVRLTYQVERAPDGAVHRVEVRPLRPGLTVRAPEWSASPSPAAAASARARRLLEDGGDRGDLPLLAAVGLAPDEGLTGRRRGTLQARVDLTGFRPGSLPERTHLRVTFAVELDEGLPFVQQELVEDQALDRRAAWTYTLPVSLPREAGTVAVVVEDLTTGAWGGTVASQVVSPTAADGGGLLPELPEGRRVATLPSAVGTGGGTGEGGGPVAGVDLPVELLPEPKAVVLVPPAGEMLTGNARFEVLTTRPDVARVDFLLDDREVKSARQAPFAARLDLGRVPRPRTVEVVARNDRGEELGRDSVRVNAGAGTFRVRLVEPRRANRVGPVDVEAEVLLPPDGVLDRVEIAWNDGTVATLHGPPFRQRVVVPPDAPQGFIGVTAFLKDGSTAEAVIFMNGPGGDESIDVRLVELLTVVTDADGNPVTGLTAADFQVLEEGRPQDLRQVLPGSEMPLSLGLLLDSSASMNDSLRRAQTAAIDFLFLTLDGDDQAFFVDFDSQPRLAQPLTGDLDAVGRAIVDVRAGGYTALSDALVFALVQVQPLAGRRALVVFSDGVGREERVPFSTALRVARQVGVPIYVLLLHQDGEEGRAARVEEIATTVGGRLFHLQDGAEAGEVYRQIREELGAQYLLTYNPGADAGEGEAGDAPDDFRRVQVRVLRPGLTARTVSGYFP